MTNYDIIVESFCARALIDTLGGVQSVSLPQTHRARARLRCVELVGTTSPFCGRLFRTMILRANQDEMSLGHVILIPIRMRCPVGHLIRMDISSGDTGTTVYHLKSPGIYVMLVYVSLYS